MLFRAQLRTMVNCFSICFSRNVQKICLHICNIFMFLTLLKCLNNFSWLHFQLILLYQYISGKWRILNKVQHKPRWMAAKSIHPLIYLRYKTVHAKNVMLICLVIFIYCKLLIHNPEFQEPKISVVKFYAQSTVVESSHAT